jgi:hypothetical protein
LSESVDDGAQKGGDMRFTLVIPSYWGRRRGEPFNPEDAVYDHPTPLDAEGTLARALESIRILRYPRFRVLVLGVAIAVSAIASVLLIGLPFLLIFVLLLVIFIPLTLALPFGMLIYAIIGAIQTYNGQNYRYPWIADWIDRQMSGSSVMAA